jgi:hypothetical protein
MQRGGGSSNRRLQRICSKTLLIVNHTATNSGHTGEGALRIEGVLMARVVRR